MADENIPGEAPQAPKIAAKPSPKPARPAENPQKTLEKRLAVVEDRQDSLESQLSDVLGFLGGGKKSGKTPEKIIPKTPETPSKGFFDEFFGSD